jgi:beta-glucosidase
MVPEDYSFYNDLLDLVTKGEVPMSRIDDAFREFKMKFEVNFFLKNDITERLPKIWPTGIH